MEYQKLIRRRIRIEGFRKLAKIFLRFHAAAQSNRVEHEEDQHQRDRQSVPQHPGTAQFKPCEDRENGRAGQNGISQIL